MKNLENYGVRSLPKTTMINTNGGNWVSVVVGGLATIWRWGFEAGREDRNKNN